MTATPLLALLERMRPDLSPAEREAIVAATPDAKPRDFRAGAKGSQKPASARCGSRPRTAASIERRRSWASAGWLPPKLACRFTLAEQAVLAVIAEQVGASLQSKLDAACTLPLDAIAALAGVCRTSVRNALRQAKALGFLAVEERRLSAWRNLPHKITVVSSEWSSWLRMRAKRSLANGSQGGGCKSLQPTNTNSIKQGALRSTPDSAKGFRRAEKAGRLVPHEDPGRPPWTMMSTNAGS